MPLSSRKKKGRGRAERGSAGASQSRRRVRPSVGLHKSPSQQDHRAEARTRPASQSSCRSSQKKSAARSSRSTNAQTRGWSRYLPKDTGAESSTHALLVRCAAVVRDLYSSWTQCQPTKNTTAQDTMKILQTCMPPDQEVGAVQTHNSLDCDRACDDRCWHHDKSTPYRSEEDHLVCRGRGCASRHSFDEMVWVTVQFRQGCGFFGRDDKV